MNVTNDRFKNRQLHIEDYQQMVSAEQREYAELKYLNAGVAGNGFFEKTEEGVPLSPLLGNIMLNELDKELERRGHKFVRFAYDAVIFCKSRKSAERTLENIVPYIEGKLFLKVNRAKTTISHISNIKYLGYAFYRYRGKCILRVHPKSVKKMKDKLRILTNKNNGWENEYRRQKLTEYVRGWTNYFSKADIAVNGRNRRMATKKNQGYLLETMEEGQNEVSYAKSAETTRMESA